MSYLIYDLVRRWHIEWFGAFVAVSQLLALLTIPSVLLQREGRPRAALSWLLAMFALPALGVLCWWAFGRTNMRRKKRRRQASTRAFLGRFGTPHSEETTEFSELIPRRALGDSIFTSTGNDITFLFDGPSAFPAIEAAILGAKRRIHVMFYIFRADETGERIRDLLAKKAREGVVVRLLVDGWGSPRIAGRFSKPLREAGGKVAAFSPSRRRALFKPRLAFANHRKMIVVDEEVAFTGGMNIGDEYAYEWRDSMVRIEGPAVAALEHIFLDDWYFASDDDVPHVEFAEPKRIGKSTCAVVASGPDRDSYIHDAYFTLLARAESRIWIVTPYFIPGEAITTALRTAASRGVDVRIVLPAESDVTVAKHAARSYYPELVSAGVRILEYKGGMLHAKALVIDDEVCTAGTANVDTRSLRLSFEVTCLIHDSDRTRELSSWCSGLMRNAHQVTLVECATRSLPQKLLQSGAHLLSPLL
jgi:cardiolipin synthase